MEQKGSYRVFALGMALLFVVFNTGIPILASSCPAMTKAGIHACPMCAPQAPPSGGSALSRASGSCCRMAFAAGRNLNEFLQVKQSVSTVSTPLPAPIVEAPGASFSGGSLRRHIPVSPPLTPIDILSRTSALLI